MHSLGINLIISAMLYYLSNNKYFLLPSCIAHFEFVAVHPGTALTMKHSCDAVFDFGLNFVPEMLSAVKVGCDYTVNEYFLTDIWHSGKSWPNG